MDLIWRIRYEKLGFILAQTLLLVYGSFVAQTL